MPARRGGGSIAGPVSTRPPTLNSTAQTFGRMPKPSPPVLDDLTPERAAWQGWRGTRPALEVIPADGI